MNYEFKTKKGAQLIWPGKKHGNVVYDFCDEPFKAKLKQTSFKRQSKPQFSVQTQKCQYWKASQNSFNLKHHGELNENIFCKIHDTAMIWLQYSLLLHTHVYMLWCNKHVYFERFTKACSIRPYWIIVIIFLFNNKDLYKCIRTIWKCIWKGKCNHVMTLKLRNKFPRDIICHKRLHDLICRLPRNLQKFYKRVQKDWSLCAKFLAQAKYSKF